MLQELNIQNFALVENLSVRFDAGLNVLTGETGAGKSIVIDAINAILGERMGADVIRSGSSRATVEGAFELSDSVQRLSELLDAGVLDREETVLVVSRDFSASGKTQCRISGRLAPVSVLRDVGKNLVDIHGQHEHQSLLNTEQHLEILDHWCGPGAAALREECARLDHDRRALKQELLEIQKTERDKVEQMDLLQFQANEIDAARLEPGEEEELQGERSRLANMEKLMAQVAQARVLLSGDGEMQMGALDALGRAARLLIDSWRDDPSLEPIADSLQNAVYMVQDSEQEVAAYHENLETNPERLEQVEERLTLLRSLKRKYGDTVQEILLFRQRIEGELSRIESAGEREAEITRQLEAMGSQLQQAASQLSEKRRAGARELERRLAKELADLALSGAQFTVGMTPQEPGATGADRVEFLFSANPGEPARPLARIASGGEMSRIMLALKSLLTASVGVPTVIFDEIDVGVGGRTGEAIGEKLAAVGAMAQVICVTHLPQIAAMADQHYLVRKEVVDGRTVVRVRKLSKDERVEELSRMLGGGRETALRHARDMLARHKQRRAGASAAQGQLLELKVFGA